MPTADEIRLLDIAEPRLELPAGVTDLSRYTRIYVRTAPGSVGGVLIRARHPGRLMADTNWDLPTEQSCRCRVISVSANLQTLWTAGQLPPFDP